MKSVRFSKDHLQGIVTLCFKSCRISLQFLCCDKHENVKKYVIAIVVYRYKFKVFLNEVCHAGTVPQVHMCTVNWDCMCVFLDV